MEEVKDHIDELLESKVIEESRSNYASPIVLIRKKTGELRLCINYRELNRNTRKYAYPIPRIMESFDSLAGSKFFTTLDLQSAYNQIEMEEEDKKKKLFVHRLGYTNIYHL